MPKGMGYGKGEREYVADQIDKPKGGGKQARRIKKMAKMGGMREGAKPLGAGSIADDVEYEMHVRKVKARGMKTRGKQMPMNEGDGTKPVGLLRKK